MAYWSCGRRNRDGAGRRDAGSEGHHGHGRRRSRDDLGDACTRLGCAESGAGHQCARTAYRRPRKMTHPRNAGPVYL